MSMKCYAYSVHAREGKLILRKEHGEYGLKLPALEDSEREITRDEVAKCYPELLPDLDEVLAGKRTNTRLLFAISGIPTVPIITMGINNHASDKTERLCPIESCPLSNQDERQ